MVSPERRSPSVEPWSEEMYIMYGGVAGDTKASVRPLLSVTRSFTIIFVKSAEPLLVTVMVYDHSSPTTGCTPALSAVFTTSTLVMESPTFV